MLWLTHTFAGSNSFMEIETSDEESTHFEFKVIKTLGKGCQAEVLQI